MMKRKLFFVIGGAVMLSAVSCSIEENKIDPEGTESRVPMEFTAGLQTKTSIDENNAVLWSAGDAISVFDSQNNRFDIASEPGSASATFTGEAIPDYGTYYALYPYSADAALSSTTLSSVLPTEQYYADGTFATMLNPSVAIAADGSTSLSFHNVASILQVNVNVSEAGDRAVRNIQVSAAETMTGAYTVAMGGDTYSAVASGSDILGASLAAENGGNMGTDFNGDGLISYYIVVLPGDYNDMTVTVNYSDGAVSESSFASVTMPASGGNILNVNAAEAEIPGTGSGLYDIFMAGENITIGGNTYNKSQFTEDQIKHITEEVNISSSNKGQILFIEPDATILSFTNQTNLVLVGNDPDNKPTLTIDASKLLVPVSGEESRLILSNLVIEPSSDFSSYMFGVNTNYTTAGAFGEFVLDNCDITMTTSPFYSISNARYLDKFVMQDCNVKVPDGSGNRFILHMSAHENVYSEIRFLNNVFYSEGTGALAFRLVSGSTTDNENKTEVHSIIVENNTFVNVAYNNSAMIVASTYGDVDITKNLIYINQNNIPEKLTSMNILRAMNNPDGYPDAPSCTDNILYSNINVADVTYNMCFNSSYVPESGELVPPVLLDTDPFKGGDLATFTPAAEYASYGAQR